MTWKTSLFTGTLYFLFRDCQLCVWKWNEGDQIVKKYNYTYLWTSYLNNKIKHHILMNKFSSLHCGQVNHAAILL